MDTLEPLDPGTASRSPDDNVPALLAQHAWLRGFAAALVRDPDAAEDLAQDTLLAALQRPPPTAASPRGWLATVARRLRGRGARVRERRRRHEAAAARPEALADSTEAVAQAELQRQLLGHVLALPPAMRETLLLRYQQGLEPAAVAERLGVPLETVHTRLRRGLEAVRARLDSDAAGPHWRRALSAFAGGGPASMWGSVGWGGALVATKPAISMVAWTLVLGLLAVGAAVLIPKPHSRRGEAPRTDGAAGGPDGGSRPHLAGSPAGKREEGSPGAIATEGTMVAWIAAPGLARAYQGQTLGADGLPLPGAKVWASASAGDTAPVTSDANGRFKLDVPLPRGADDAFQVLARRDQLVGFASVWGGRPPSLPQESLRIMLGRGGPLSVRVRSSGRAIAGAEVTLQLHMSSAAPARVGGGRTDATGRWGGGLWPAGTYRACAAVPGVGRASGWIVVPHDAPELTIDVREGSTFTVRVLERGTETPVAGAEVRLFESPWQVRSHLSTAPYVPAPEIAPTDARGETRVAGVEVGPQFCVVAYSAEHQRPGLNVGFDPQSVLGAVPADGVVVRYVTPRTQGRWRVEAGDIPVPADGTRVRVRSVDRNQLSGAGCEVEGEVTGGNLLAPVFFDRGAYAEAFTPEGHRADLTWRDGQPEGRPTSFRRARTGTVRVVRPDGSPAEGVLVRLGEGLEGSGAPRRTDANGEARFDGLFDLRRRIHVFPPGAVSTSESDPIGEIDLASGSGTAEVRIPWDRQVEIRTRIDGKPALPFVRSVLAITPIDTYEADAATGVLRLVVRPLPRVKVARVTVVLQGFHNVQVDVPNDGSQEPFTAEVDLVRRLSVLAHVLQPADGIFSLRLERWSSDAGAWAVERSSSFDPLPPGVRFLELSTATPGRHRLVDEHSGMAGPEGMVEAAGAVSRLELDLSEVVSVTGRVELPAGFSVGSATVRRRVPGDLTSDAPSVPAQPPRPPGARLVVPARVVGEIRVGADGSFTVRLRRGDSVELAVSHPQLAPHSELGRAMVTAGGPAPRLVLVQGRHATLRLGPSPTAVENNAPSVRLYRDVVGLVVGGSRPAEPVSKHPLEILPGGSVRFGGYEPGTYTLWFDVPPYAPFVVPSVTLGEGTTELGERRLEEGLRVRVRVVPAEGQPAPETWIAAYAQDPRHARIRNGADASQPLELAGLRPGIYRLTVGLSRTGERVLDEQVTLREGETLERLVDLRGR